jgi:hypothetical protein
MYAKVLAHTGLTDVSSKPQQASEPCVIHPVQTFIPAHKWADKEKENKERKKYARLHEDTIKRIRAMYDDGVKDPSLKSTAEIIQSQLLKEDLAFVDKVLLKVSFIKTLLKPYSKKELAQRETEIKKVEEAKQRKADGLSPLQPWRHWVLHFAGGADKAEYVDLNSGDVVKEKPNELNDEERDVEREEELEEMMLLEEEENNIEGSDLYDPEGDEEERVCIEYLDIPDDCLLGDLSDLCRALYRVYYANSVSAADRIQMNEEVMNILKNAENEICNMFASRNLTVDGLRCFGTPVTILPKRTARAFYKSEQYLIISRSEPGGMVTRNLDAEFDMLSSEAKEKYWKLELADAKRFYVEKYLYNCGERPEKNFLFGDCVAIYMDQTYHLGTIISGNGTQFRVKLMKDASIIDSVSSSKVMMIPSAEYEETWIKDLSPQEKVLARRSLDSTEYAFAVHLSTDVKKKTCFVKFPYEEESIEINLYLILCRQKRKPHTRKAIAISDTPASSSNITKWNVKRLRQELEAFGVPTKKMKKQELRKRLLEEIESKKMILHS